MADQPTTDQVGVECKPGGGAGVRACRTADTPEGRVLYSGHSRARHQSASQLQHGYTGTKSHKHIFQSRKREFFIDSPRKPF